MAQTAFAQNLTTQERRFVRAVNQSEFKDVERALASTRFSQGVLDNAVRVALTEDMVRLLVAHGASANAQDPLSGETVLMRSIYAGAIGVQPLLNMGADPNARDFRGSTAMHDAAVNVNLEAIRALAAGGAQIDARDNMGVTPLMGASQSNRAPAVDLLLSLGSNPRLRDHAGRGALTMAEHALQARARLLEAGLTEADSAIQPQAATPRIPLAIELGVNGRISAIEVENTHSRQLANGCAISAGPGVIWLVRLFPAAAVEDLTFQGEAGVALRRSCGVTVRTTARAGNADPETSVELALIGRNDMRALVVVMSGSVVETITP